jgi:hypothetical protein
VSIAVAVGHDEDPVTAVRGTNGCRWDAVPFRIVPARGQVSENSAESPASEGGNVLHENVARSNQANDPDKLAPETRLLARETFPLACVRDVLARKAAADELDVGELFDFPYVTEPLDLRPVLLEDSSCIIINRNLPNRSEVPCPLEAQLNSSDACEQAADCEDSYHRPDDSP